MSPSKAIEINPNEAIYYYNRGWGYKNLGEKQKAKESWSKAAELYKKQGKTRQYQRTINQIKQLDSD
ncbi:MAG: tetratricopeptide repeat protein [Prochloraceae cyanobacterium]|nr:tetratricopeptide repeat protein [Prochloraceae cyanobacterium]